jgi:HEAT repeat protein
MTVGAIPTDRLRDVVLGRDRAFARPAAFAQLAASTLPDREQLLATVLDGASERPDVRTSAAIALGRIATDASERLLLEGLAHAHSPRRLRQAIARALGRIGGEAALAPLDQWGRSTDRPVADAARFGAALIAHRLGLAGHDLPLPDASQLLPPPSPPGARPIAFGPAPPDLGAQVIDGLRCFPCRFVEYDEDSILAISCGDARLALALNRELRVGSIDLFERTALAGVVALRSDETDRYSIGLVLLTTPADDEVNLQVVTASGRPTLFGSARRTGTDLAFELRALARPGARATRIAGALSGGRVTVHDAVSSAVREPPRRPLLVGSRRGPLRPSRTPRDEYDDLAP